MIPTVRRNPVKSKNIEELLSQTDAANKVAVSQRQFCFLTKILFLDENFVCFSMRILRISRREFCVFLDENFACFSMRILRVSRREFCVFLDANFACFSTRILRVSRREFCMFLNANFPCLSTRILRVSQREFCGFLNENFVCFSTRIMFLDQLFVKQLFGDIRNIYENLLRQSTKTSMKNSSLKFFRAFTFAISSSSFFWPDLVVTRITPLRAREP